MTEITKAYKFKTFENKAKKHETLQIIQERQKILVEYSIDAYELLRTTGEVPLYKPGIKSDNRLAQVVLRDCWMQVKNTYTTILPAMKNYGRQLITSLEVEDEELKKQLYYINKYGKWLTTDSIKKFTVTKEAKEYSQLLLETIFQEFKNKLPLLGTKETIAICSSGKLEAKKNPENTFDYWLNVHGVKSRKPIKIPIKSDEYYENLSGVKNLSVSLRLNEEDELEVITSKTVKVEEYTPLKSEELGLDWGFKSLFSTSDGRLLGLQFHKKLIEWDEKLQALTSQLQKLELPLKANKRYRKLQVRIKNFIKNEVGRILNKLASEGWSALSIEALDFRGKDYSKRMNRLLSRAGRGVISDKLKSFENVGLPVNRVNPAYTSQECSGCSFVHRLNRNGKLFTCKFCHLSLDGDLNAARNILRRSQEGNSWLFIKKNIVLGQLDQLFESRWGLSPSLVIERLGLSPQTS